MLRTANARPILSPDTVGPLLLTPTIENSILGKIGTTFISHLAEGGNTLRLPKMGAADAADWIAEGEEIPLDDVAIDELVIDAKRLTGGAVLTRELIEDANMAVPELIGAELARDLARKVDIAFFGAQGTNPERPEGLGDLQGHTRILGTLESNGNVPIEVFFAAQEQAETAVLSIDAWVTHPSTASAISRTLATFSGANGFDASRPVGKTVMGVPVIATPNVAAGTLWGFHKPSVIFFVHKAAQVDADSSVYFLSYRVAMRSRIRCGWGFANKAGVTEISLTPPTP